MLLTCTLEPAEEPASLEEVKDHLKVLHASENTAIGIYAKVARKHVESIASRALVTQTWRLWLPAFPASGVIELPRPPLQSVTHVKYLDADGVQQTLASTNYHVLKETVLGGRIERKASVSWPATATDPKAVEIEFIAGYGAASAVPVDLKHCILLLTEHLFYNRGETSDEPLTKNPFAVDALLGPYKTHGFI